MNAKNIVGWVILMVGFTIVALAIGFSYQFFTARADFPVIFKSAPAAQSAAVQAGQNANTGDPQADAGAQMQQAVNAATSKAISDMFPADDIAKLLNAITWSVFATFLVYAGAKFANIGVKMIS